MARPRPGGFGWLARSAGGAALWIGVLALMSWGYRRACHGALEQPVFRLEAPVGTLAVGDSHPQASLDPAVLAGGANVANSAENLFFTFYKLRFLLDRNPAITNVILGLAPHNFSKGYQESLLFGETATLEDFEAYYPLLDREGRRTLRSPRRGYLLATLKYDLGVPIQFYRNRAVTKLLMGRVVHRADFDWVGGFYGSERSDLDVEKMRRKITLYYLGADGRYTGVSDLMRLSLHRIMALCQERDVRLWIYTSPEHAWFRSRVPREANLAFERVRADAQRDFPAVRWLDFSESPLPDEAFGDGDHTNARGARIVSALVRNRLADSDSGASISRR
jgi:hypothetical protein